MFKTQLSSSTPRRSMASRRKRRGQTLVETSLCLAFILLPMVFAGLQFAIVINATHALEEISREAARFAAVHGGETTFAAVVTQADPPSYRNYVRRVCANTTIAYSDLTFSPPAVPSSGEPITVTFTYPMSRKMIFFSAKWASYGTFMATLAGNRTVSATYLME